MPNRFGKVFPFDSISLTCFTPSTHHNNEMKVCGVPRHILAVRQRRRCGCRRRLASPTAACHADGAAKPLGTGIHISIQRPQEPRRTAHGTPRYYPHAIYSSPATQGHYSHCVIMDTTTLKICRLKEDSPKTYRLPLRFRIKSTPQSCRPICTAGHKSHDPCFHKIYMEAGAMTFKAHCTTEAIN